MALNETESVLLELYGRVDWSLIPSHMWSGLKEWIEFGRPQGSFLMSILEHDFYEAIFRADNMNQAAIVGWAQLLCWHLPHECHGSPQKCRSWTDRGGLRGILAQESQTETVH